MALLLALPARARAQAATPDTTWPGSLPPGQWQLPGGDYAQTRFSPLTAITTANVAGLKPVWSFSTGSLRANEGSPLVVDSVMFVHTPFPNAVFALDLARPGAPILWKYEVPAATRRLNPPAGWRDVGSLGLAYHPSGKLYVPLFQGELAALDAATGREIWRVKNADREAGGSMPGAPLVVRDLVVVGTGGAEYGVRGSLTAYNALTGQLVWRVQHTGPDSAVGIRGDANPAYASHRGRDLGVTSWAGDGWQHGGATASGWLAYDPELDLIYYGTDHPAPLNPASRPGDDKWSSTIFARSAATGEVRWAYQVTPHDEWGYDASNETILADLTVDGTPVKALVHLDANGFGYTIDRTTGKVLLAARLGPVNWATHVDLTTGIPSISPAFETGSGARVNNVCPATIGLKGHQPAAFSPGTSLFFVPLNNLCMSFRATAATYQAGKLYTGATIRMSAGPGGSLGRFVAWDAATGTIAWQVQEPYPVTGGALATAGGLVFYGTMDGWLKAVDQHTGQELWRYKTASGIMAAPMTFLGPDGRQYVAVLSGLGGWLGAGGNGAIADPDAIANPGGVLTVFAL